MKTLKPLLPGLLAALSAYAVALPPNSAVNGPLGAASAAGISGACDFVTSATYSANGGTATGTLHQCAERVAPTTYDFYYQIVANNTSTSPISALLLRGFGGYTVSEVAEIQTPAGFPAPTVGVPAPLTDPTGGQTLFSISRSTDGSNITSVYAPFGVGPVPASSFISAIIRIRVTDADGVIALIPPTSGTINGTILASQLAPTPEPSFYAAVSLGLAGLFVARRRKMASRQAAE